MVKKHMKADDGMYHIKGKKFQVLKGSRAQVWHGTAYKTKGDLNKDHLMMNKHGRVVSRKKHNTAKKEKRLEKAGYFTKKGKFGFVKRSSKVSSPKKTRKHKKRH
jgi:hypothetical protein